MLVPKDRALYIGPYPKYAGKTFIVLNYLTGKRPIQDNTNAPFFHSDWRKRYRVVDIELFNEAQLNIIDNFKNIHGYPPNNLYWIGRESRGIREKFVNYSVFISENSLVKKSNNMKLDLILHDLSHGLQLSKSTRRFLSAKSASN